MASDGPAAGRGASTATAPAGSGAGVRHSRGSPSDRAPCSTAPIGLEGERLPASLPDAGPLPRPATRLVCAMRRRNGYRKEVPEGWDLDARS